MDWPLIWNDSYEKTEQVLIEVIESAKEKIFLSSFVAYDVEKVLELLRRLIQRGVKVSMLLESSELHGGGVSMDVIAKMKEALPEAFIYYWKKKDDGFDGGKSTQKSPSLMMIFVSFPVRI